MNISVFEVFVQIGIGTCPSIEIKPFMTAIGLGILLIFQVWIVISSVIIIVKIGILIDLIEWTRVASDVWRSSILWIHLAGKGFVVERRAILANDFWFWTKWINEANCALGSIFYIWREKHSCYECSILLQNVCKMMSFCKKKRVSGEYCHFTLKCVMLT